MDKNKIKTIIRDYHRRITGISVLQRGMRFEPCGSYVLVGLRRAGKSYTMFQDIQKLIADGEAAIEDFLYINFEDDRLGDIRMDELDDIITAYGDMYPGRKPRVYLDEIQIVKGWEKFARRLADTGYVVRITGSNASMLSSEMATTLGGRFIVRHVSPFSFSEFLAYKGVTLDGGWHCDTPVCNTVRALFDDYFHYGGFAEHFDRADKREWINGLCQKILLGDIIARNDIRNSVLVRLLARKLAESVMQPSTQTRLTNILKSTGSAVSRNTVAEYLGYMEDAFMIFSLNNYVDSLAEQVNNRKRYFSDNGLLNNYLIDPDTKLLENMVAIALKQRYCSVMEDNLYYYNKGIEVDFYVPSEQMAVQVAYSIDDEDTRRREINALEKMSAAFGIARNIIITMDTEETVTTEKGIRIEVVPVWKWLLEK